MAVTGNDPDIDYLAAASDDQDVRPIVALPRSGVPGAAIAAVATVAAIGLFLVLDGQRRRAAILNPDRSQTVAGAFAQPPALLVPQELPPVPPTVTIVTTPAPTLPPERLPPVFAPAPMPQPATIIVPQPAMPIAPLDVPERRTTRVSGPAIVFDAGADQASNPIAGSSVDQGGRANRPPGAGGGAGTDDTPARATLIGDRTTIMPTGTVIPAVLETPIDTARPGLVRAVISQDTRGFDGRRVLVARGSRLIGEYQSDVRSGQNRVLVTWTRLIRPDGVTIRLGSPAADPMGGAGVPGHVNTFFFQRFASAVLQSALTVGVNLASRPGSGSVIVGLPGPVNTVGQALTPANDLRPKITVKQGAAVNVFVARDLDFSGVPSRP